MSSVAEKISSGSNKQILWNFNYIQTLWGCFSYLNKMKGKIISETRGKLKQGQRILMKTSTGMKKGTFLGEFQNNYLPNRFVPSEHHIRFVSFVEVARHFKTFPFISANYQDSNCEEINWIFWICHSLNMISKRIINGFDINYSKWDL